MPLALGTATGTAPTLWPKLEGAAVQLGGDETVEACGIVSGFGIAVPTDCWGALPALDRA